MRVEQFRWTPDTGWRPALTQAPERPTLCLAFGTRHAFADPRWQHDVALARAGSTVVGCTTAGEIAGTAVFDGSVVVTFLEFDRTRFDVASVALTDVAESESCGEVLGARLSQPGLTHVLVLSDGVHVNGTALVAGLRRTLPEGVGVTGGLSGDGNQFEETLIACGGEVASRRIAAVGLYGDGLRIGMGCVGGWDPFGPERRVTRSEGPVLYEMDGRSALDLYRAYLGDHARDLPASALLFPLSIRATMTDRAVVRTVVGVDASDQSMTFAGDIPQGAYARLMRANFDRLIDGAAHAARATALSRTMTPTFALLISCFGRRLVLGERVEEEIESVREILGSNVVFGGFYSYGEISPFTPEARCELHNQTITITTMSESLDA